jgi:hypothetical protein
MLHGGFALWRAVPTASRASGTSGKRVISLFIN